MTASTVRSAFALLLLASAVLVGQAAPAMAQVQTSGRAKCVAGLSKAATKLAKTQGKDGLGCMKSFASGKLASCQTAEGCLVADVKGKVAKAKEKLRQAFLKNCQNDEPDFAAPDYIDAHRLIRFHTNALGADVFGAGIDSTLATRESASDVAKCQGSAAKSLQKLFDARFSAYGRCKAAGVSDGSIDGTAALEACIDAVAAGDAKIDKAAGKVVDTLNKSCAEVDQAAAFPARCATGDAATCMAERALCRFCLLANDLDDTSVDCDLYDDEVANDSCTVADGRCNGSSLLCDRAFDAVSYPTSHNAFTNAEEGWGLPNQNLGMKNQLEAGVRSLMLDTYLFSGVPHLCHGLCDVNELAKWREPLVDGLVRIREFLDDNPGEVVSIIFESYLSEALTASSFTAAGLDGYLHEQGVGDPWPTLADLIASGKRLVVFTDDGSASLPWHLYVWDFAWETHFSFETVEDFSCTINRGSMSNSLFILNHFLTTPIGGNLNLSRQANADSLFTARAGQCQDESGRLPNFVTVDFVDVGALFKVVDGLNATGACVP